MAIDFDSETFLLDSYTGQGGFLSGHYLVQYIKEADEKYLQRRMLSIRPNFVKKVVDSYLGYLFRTPPTRGASALQYKRFIDNADGTGSHLDAFISMAEKYAMLFGTVFLIVDLEEGSPTPYLSLRTPYQLDDSRTRYDSRGRLLSICFIESYNDVEEYRYFDTENWMLLDADGSVIKQGAHRLGRVPVVPLHSQAPVLGRRVASSWIYDLSRLNFDLYNVMSEAREILRNITFPILLIPRHYRSEDSAANQLIVGVNNALTYSPEDGPPSFISPSPDAVTQLKKHAEDLIKNIYQQVNLEYVSGFASGSGLAISYFFAQTQSALSGMAELIESAENQIGDLVCMYSGESYDGRVSYSRDYDLEDITTELQVAMDSLSMSISDTFDKELKKSIARDILGREVSSEIYKQIDGEIDNKESSEPYSDVINKTNLIPDQLPA